MYRLIIGSLAALSVGFVVDQASAGIVIGGFNAARGGVGAVADGSYVDDGRNSLLSHFQVDAINSTTELTPAFLSGIDLLIISNADSPSTGTALSLAEQIAVRDYVNAGGRAFVIIEGFETDTSQSFAAPFGLVIADDNLSGVMPLVPVAPPHPVWNGPYGDQFLGLFYGAGKFTALNGATPVARAFLVAEPGIVAFDHNQLAPGSGRVVVTADTTPFIDGDVNSAAFPAHEVLWLNSLAYLIEPVPEPATWILAVSGMTISIRFARSKSRRTLRQALRKCPRRNQ